jgi:hypothetical protein
VLCCGVYDVYIVSLPLALGFGERGVGFNEMVVCRLVFDWNTVFYITYEKSFKLNFCGVDENSRLV